MQNFEKIAKFLKIQLAHFVDLEKRCKMSILLQKSVLIQPRTSPPKSSAELCGQQELNYRKKRELGERGPAVHGQGDQLDR